MPYGVHTLVVNYSGMETWNKIITVDSPTPQSVNVELSSPVVMLDAFVVTGEREGNAASITRQRQSENVRTVLSFDALGNMPNDNIAELITRMPGISGIRDDTGEMYLIGVRGTSPALNTLTIDGFTQPSNVENARHASLSAISGALFEEIEIIKAQTPEKRADSLGGGINLRTRSLFKMRGNRRTTYNIAFRWQPPFFDPTPAGEDRPIHPQFSFSHQQIFSAFGGRRNFAISIDGVYNENMIANRMAVAYCRNIFSPSEKLLAGESEIPDVVGIYDNEIRDVTTLVKQKSFSLKAEYRVTPHLALAASFIYADSPQPGYTLTTQRARASQGLQIDPITGTENPVGPIMPGYTNSRTQVRPTTRPTDSYLQIQSQLLSSMSRNRGVTAEAKIKYDRVEADFGFNYSSRHLNVGTGLGYGRNGGGSLSYYMGSAGWIYDRTRSFLYPSLTQTAGPDWFDIENYGIDTLTYQVRDYKDQMDVYTIRADFRYNLPTSFPLMLKTGFLLNRDERARKDFNTKNYSYKGIASLSKFLDNSIVTSSTKEQGPWPYLSPLLVADDHHDNPSDWPQNIYTDTQNQMGNTRNLTEDVGACYIQANTRIGPFSIVGGVRLERTWTDVHGHVRSAAPTSKTEQAADPFGSAVHDFGIPRHNKGSYDHYFPSLHLVWHITRNFQVRASWSNSIGRPEPAQLYPAETVTEASDISNGVVSYNDPNIKPQTSVNWDLMIEYYFEPVGQLSVGFFYKNLSDFIYRDTRGLVPEGADNGFGGNYAGYDLNYNTNGGSAWIKGIEFSYQQDLSFLPGFLRRLSVFANYTWLDTEGDYDMDGEPDDAIAYFMPRSGNVGLTYRWKGVIARANVNYSGDYYFAASTNIASRVFAEERTILNVSLSYTLPRSRLSVFVDCSNITREEQRWYMYKKDRAFRVTYSAPIITFGMRGSF